VRPLILQLQEDLVKGLKKTDELLRLAKLIVGKLQIDALEHWIEREITGYPRNETLPDYRVVLAGHLEVLNPVRGWIPVSGTGRITVPVYQSIGELELFMEKDFVQYQPTRPFPVNDITGSGLLSGMPQRALIATSGFKRIVENVRNKLLDWSLELEKKGVLGENMAFSSEEKQTARNITVNNIEKFTGILGNVSNSHFAIYDYSSIHKTIKEAGVPVEERNRLEEIIDGLKQGDEEKKQGWLQKGKDWITKNQEFLGASASIIRQALGLDSAN
jgi:AbiTii